MNPEISLARRAITYLRDLPALVLLYVIVGSVKYFFTLPVVFAIGLRSWWGLAIGLAVWWVLQSIFRAVESFMETET